jgi:hypothetical protein
VRHAAPVALAVILSAAMATAVLAAEPTPTPGSGGDPRSPGEGPGLVGDPAFAIIVVVIVGLLSVGLTLVYVRLSGPGPGRRGT